MFYFVVGWLQNVRNCQFSHIVIVVYCLNLQKNQRYNISEDTWQQVLAFSRSVHENLEGYDREGIKFMQL